MTAQLHELQDSQDDSLLTPQEMWEKLDRIADTEEQWLDGKAAYLRQRMTGQDDIIGRLGAGLQYVVYEVPESRVFKVPQTRISAANESIRQGCDPAELEKILRRREEGAAYTKHLVQSHPETMPLFGNPMFNNEQGSAGAIEQDRLTFVDNEAFSSWSTEDQIRYIQQYIVGIKTMWTYGCADRSMNFQVNTGLNGEHQVVLADFGEMDLTKEAALKTVTNKRWKYAWGVRSLSPEVRQAAVAIFEQELTQSALENLWATNL